MSLLKKIQEHAVDANVDISSVLRECKILAARLGNAEFKLWVECELNGYTRTEDLPDYRKLRVQSYGDFVSVAWKITNHPIPPLTIPEKYRDFITSEYLMDPISYYASLIGDSKANGDNFKVEWPADLIALVGSKILERMNLMSAWKQIPRGSIVALLDTVRNRILSFVLEIEAEAPDAGEPSQNHMPIPEERIGQIFNTIIASSITHLSTSNQTILYDTKITVLKDDLSSLKQYLTSLGIGKDDLEKLDIAIHDDSKSGDRKQLGDKVGAWIGKMINKAANGTWKIATSAAGTLLAKALSIYFGIE